MTIFNSYVKLPEGSSLSVYFGVQCVLGSLVVRWAHQDISRTKRNFHCQCWWAFEYCPLAAGFIPWTKYIKTIIPNMVDNTNIYKLLDYQVVGNPSIWDSNNGSPCFVGKSWTQQLPTAPNMNRWIAWNHRNWGCWLQFVDTWAIKNTNSFHLIKQIVVFSTSPPTMG